MGLGRFHLGTGRQRRRRSPDTGGAPIAESSAARSIGFDVRPTLHRLNWPASITLYAAFPVVVLVALFVTAIQDDAIAMDFHQFYAAADAIRGGHSPYPAADQPLTFWGGPYPYPPLPALVTIPLTALSFEAAGLLVMALLVAVAFASLFILGVRDWRCYGLMLLWPPVISAIQTANLSLWFTLALAIAWRFRNRMVPLAVSIALTLAAKFFLWPLVGWLLATRRFLSATLASAIAGGALLLSWAMIGFAGMTDYPGLLQRVEAVVAERTYTPYILGIDLGLPLPVARSVWIALGLGLLAAVVVLAMGDDERSAFVLAIAASLALAPILWLHYFALLLVVVAISQPRLGLAWFIPLGMFVATGHGNPSPFQEGATILCAAATIAVCLAAIRTTARRTIHVARLAPAKPRGSPTWTGA